MRRKKQETLLCEQPFRGCFFMHQIYNLKGGTNEKQL